MNRNLISPFFLTVCFAIWAFTITPNPQSPERKKIADQMEYHVKHEMLNKWYPAALDRLYGGFITTYSYNFKPVGDQEKFIVTQARHTWSSAKAADFFPKNQDYKNSTQHGFRFLRDVMWDKESGGFYTLVDRKGAVINKGFAPKEAYGNSFALYALAANYKSTGDLEVLNLAKKAFYWMEEHSHDPIYKGYYQHMERDGSPIKRPAYTPSTSELGYKDQNTSIHMLESLTELYTVWQDDLVKERLIEMLALVRDKITTKKGYLTLFFSPDWTPVSYRDSSRNTIMKNKHIDHVSFGHDVETAYLMLEASHVAGLRNDTLTMKIAKRMLDHAIVNGWDNKLGGFYDEGYYFKDKPGITILARTKNWWAQAEGLNSLLLMADHFPKDKMRYFEKFKLLWKYSQAYLIDHRYGDWYEGGLDKEPDRRTANKSHIWKGNYHQLRAMLNCIERLKKPGIHSNIK